ncbi:hypothetical protein D9M73_227550 [compost metagenome]
MGQGHDLFYHIALLEIDHMRGPQLTCNGQSRSYGVDTDDSGCAHQPGTCHGAQADRPEGEHRDCVTDPHATAFGTGKAGGHDVRAHQHLFIAQTVGDW